MREPVFKSQPLNQLFNEGRIIHYKKGEVLLHAGEIPIGISFIRRGHIKVYSIGTHGNENLHLIYRHGEIFPLSWLLQNRVRNDYFEALDPVTVAILSREHILSRAQEDIDILNGLLGQAAAQLYIFADRVDNLGYQDSYHRTIYRLLFLAGRLGQRSSNGHVIIDVPLTHQQIADSINLSRETVSRNVHRLEQAGLVGYRSRRLVIPDIKALQAQIDDPVNPEAWGLSSGLNGLLSHRHTE